MDNDDLMTEFGALVEKWGLDDRMPEDLFFGVILPDWSYLIRKEYESLDFSQIKKD